MKDMINKKIAIVGIILFIILNVVSAEDKLSVSLTTPKVVFTGQMGEVKEYYIGVRNRNDFKININITPQEDMTFEETSFSLNPNEEKQAKYKITLTKAGNYSLMVPVKFEGNNNTFSLAQQIILSDIKASTDLKYYFVIGIIIALMMLVVGLFVHFGNKRESATD